MSADKTFSGQIYKGNEWRGYVDKKYGEYTRTYTHTYIYIYIYIMYIYIYRQWRRQQPAEHMTTTDGVEE